MGAENLQLATEDDFDTSIEFCPEDFVIIAECLEAMLEMGRGKGNMPSKLTRQLELVLEKVKSVTEAVSVDDDDTPPGRLH